MRTLVVGAYAPEIDRLGDGVIARAIGVGLIDAALGAQAALAEVAPARVIFVGTAGALPGSRLAVGDVVVAAQARLALRPGEYAPGIMTTVVAGDEELVARAAETLGARRVTVACAIGITSDDAEAARLGGAAEVEHLECFALFAAAARAGVAATAVLAIANDVGAQAAAQWRANRVAAEAAAQRAVARLIG